MDCNWCIIGHSERRHIMKETDIDIGQKAKRALDDEMSAIICIGETMMENEMRQTK
jgi:triosephosphate isomerase (TIM)